MLQVSERRTVTLTVYCLMCPQGKKILIFACFNVLCSVMLLVWCNQTNSMGQYFSPFVSRMTLQVALELMQVM